MYKRTVDRYNNPANTYNSSRHFEVQYVLGSAIFTFLVYKLSIYPKFSHCQE